jgi:hypothetical protein
VFRGMVIQVQKAVNRYQSVVHVFLFQEVDQPLEVPTQDYQVLILTEYKSLEKINLIQNDTWTKEMMNKQNLTGFIGASPQKKLVSNIVILILNQHW